MLRAEFDPSYFRRFLWIALACAGFGCWCLYDAFVAYPAERERAIVYEQIKQEMKDQDRSIDTGKAWRAYAGQQGWSTELPNGTPKEITEKIGKQFFMLVLCAVFGVPSLIKWYRGQSTWVEGDEERIRNSFGQEVVINEITKINKRKWDAKGIAVIHHTLDGEPQKKFVMDDYKYNREVMGKLIMFAEAGLSDDQITGGKSERQKIKDQKQAEREKAEQEKANAEAAEES